MQTGDRVTVKIEKLLFGGNGLAHAEGCAIFIPGGIPGETVLAELTQIKKRYMEGRLLEVVYSSPYRRTPPCPIFSECGGCDLQHIDDSPQLSYKVEAIRELLGRIARLHTVALASPIPSTEPLGYRIRVQLKVAGKTIGFFRRGSHQIVEVNQCPISSTLINRTISRLSAFFSVTDSEGGGIEEIHLHVAESPEQVLMILSLDKLRPGRFHSVFQSLSEEVPLVGLVLRAGKSRHVFGQDYINLTLLGQRLRVSDRSFVQGNWRMNEKIVTWAEEELGIEKGDRILEMYAGIGNFTLPFAQRAGSVVSLEGSRSAVKDAKLNIKNAGLKNVQVLEGSVEWGVQRLVGRFDRIFIDPPRTGVNPFVLRSLPHTAKRLVYLSCHPATLARDLRLLIDCGWHLVTLQPFDLFPQTAHLELGAVLERSAL